MSTIVTLTTAAAGTLLKKPLQATTEAVGIRLSASAAKTAAKSLPKTLTSLRLVKTLWQIDKRVDLFNFYYPSRLTDATKNNGPVSVDTISDIPANSHILVQGTAGQGKSMMARYLAWQAAVKEKRFPIFIELRTLRGTLTLRNAIYKFIDDHLHAKSTLGNSSRMFFDHFINSGHVTVLLDGFDEIPRSMRPKVVDEFDSLVTRYPNAKFFVTSRPDNRIASSPHLHKFNLTPLTPDDHDPIIRKLVDDEEVATEIIEQLQREDGNLRNLLTTPLLVTLLVINHNATQRLPQSYTEFYDSLFMTLLTRHDASKPGGVDRERLCGLDDISMHNMFDALSFETMKRKLVELSDSEMDKSLKAVSKAPDFTGNPWDFLEDIESGVCLIVRDGDAHRFIHKSVQEFHAARYIQGLPDDKSKIFYNRANLKQLWTEDSQWAQVVRFLDELDGHRFMEQFEIANIANFLNTVLLKVPTTQIRRSAAAAARMLDGAEPFGYIYIYSSDKNNRSIYVYNPKSLYALYHTNNEVEELLRKLASLCSKNQSESLQANAMIPIEFGKSSKNSYDLIPKNMLKMNSIADEVVDLCMEFVEGQFARYSELIEQVALLEQNQDEFLDGI